jgi:hypothetical protein
MPSTKLIWFDPVVVVSTKAQRESAISGIGEPVCVRVLVLLLWAQLTGNPRNIIFSDNTPLVSIGIVCEHAAPGSLSLWDGRNSQTGAVQNAVFNAVFKYAFGAYG